MRIGVLALQGAFREHLQALAELGVAAQPVRLPEHLEGIDGLIIPGGESTTIGKLAEWYGLLPAIAAIAAGGKPIWGTCAGLILLARELVGYEEQPRLPLLDITVRRNGFGRQVDSFEVALAIPALAEAGLQAGPFPGVFIRAPLIEAVRDGVRVLSRLEDGTAVAVQQGQVLGTAFHPELTPDRRLHRFFLSLVPAVSSQRQ
jgi:5'-phosphate synthase pdxT subunit